MKKIIIIILFATTSTLSAQSISALAQEIRQKNPLLQALNNEYLAALERIPQVGQLPDLELGVGVFPLPVETRLGPQALRVGATQMFPWFGTLAQQEKLALAKSRATYERTDAAALKLLFSLQENYLELYELQRSQTIIHENLRLLASLEQVALARVESGRGSLADVLKVQKEKTALEHKLTLLAEAETAPTVVINQLRQADLQAALRLTDSLLFTPLSFDRDTLEAYLQKYHPELRMLQQQQVVSQQAIMLNGLNNKPSFGLGADYIVVNPRENATINNNGRDILQLRATVRIPLSSKPYRAREREEELRILAYAQREENTLSQMLAVIEKAYSLHETAMLQKSYLEQQTETTAAILRILRDQYSTEGGDFAELLRLEQELISYRLQYLQVQVDSHRSKNQIMQFVLQ